MNYYCDSNRWLWCMSIIVIDGCKIRIILLSLIYNLVNGSFFPVKVRNFTVNEIHVQQKQLTMKK